MATEKKRRQLSELATRIADELFTSGGGEQAQRLVLTIDTPTPRDLGGWNKRAVTDFITQSLVNELAK